MNHGVRNLSKIKHELKGSLELSSYCDYFLRLVENEGKPVFENFIPRKI